MNNKPPVWARALLVFASGVMLLAGLQLGMALGDYMVAHRSDFSQLVLLVGVICLVGGWALKWLSHKRD